MERPAWRKMSLIGPRPLLPIDQPETPEPTPSSARRHGLGASQRRHIVTAEEKDALDACTSFMPRQRSTYRSRSNDAYLFRGERKELVA